MSGSCAWCTFWKRHTSASTLGVCNAIELLDVPGNALPPENGAGINAGANDDYKLGAELLTRATFGCTLFTKERKL
jgi:hypothetical protein